MPFTIPNNSKKKIATSREKESVEKKNEIREDRIIIHKKPVFEEMQAVCI